jgi:hypothetical protein
VLAVADPVGALAVTEVYTELPCAKDAGVMARLLPQYPRLVLEHYAWREAPPEVAALLPAYFGSGEVACEGSFGKWLCADAALAAFELAAGLDHVTPEPFVRLPPVCAGPTPSAKGSQPSDE